MRIHYTNSHLTLTLTRLINTTIYDSTFYQIVLILLETDNNTLTPHLQICHGTVMLRICYGKLPSECIVLII